MVAGVRETSAWVQLLMCSSSLGKVLMVPSGRDDPNLPALQTGKSLPSEAHMNGSVSSS